MRIGNQRTVYGEALLALGAEDPRVVVLEADLGKSTMTHAFQQAYPDRYFEMGIAEANMTSFAVGLSLTGRVAFTNSFAVFAAGRAYDQIRQGVAIGRVNVKIVGSSAGLSDFGDGATHQSVEDIAIMRAIPHMTVLVPADAPQTAAMVRWMAAHDGPVYLRISRNDLPEITGPGDGVLTPYVLRAGGEVALVATGAMVFRALKAAEALAAAGIQARVVNVPCLKPLSDEAVRSACEGVRAIVTAEEHSIVGGLASAVSMALRGDARPQRAVAIGDVFGQSAPDAETLMRHYGLTEGDIQRAAAEALNGL